ncbi:MAG: lysostaphin resistance A-like protein [Limisphaerales bacterium]
MVSAKPWRSEAVAQFIAMQLFCFCFGLILVGLLQKTGLAAFKAPAGFGAVLLATLGFQGATWVLIPIFLQQHQANWRETFGFRGPQLPRALVTAIVVTIVILLVAWSLQYLSALVLIQLGWLPEEQEAVTLITGSKSWWMRIYLGVFAVVLAPVAEEFIFRGMLYPFVKQLGSPRCAWLGVNAIFALIHLDIGTLVPLFALALALTWLYERTDNLLAPITAHSLFNAVNLVLLSFAGQMNQFFEKIFHTIHQT